MRAHRAQSRIVQSRYPVEEAWLMISRVSITRAWQVTRIGNNDNLQSINGTADQVR